MKISDAQYERIAGYFPIQTDNRDFINAILYITENGCKWRALREMAGKQMGKKWNITAYFYSATSGRNYRESSESACD